MTHVEVQELLEDYVDDRLDRPTRKKVDDHLRTCEACRALLDEVAPVDLAGVGPTRFDERAMRRTVRRSVVRTSYSTLVLLLAAYIILWLFTALVFQPLVINRGGRAADAARATIDVTSMINPGAIITDGQIQSGLLDREMDFEVALQVGSGVEELGTVNVRLGALSLSGPDGVGPWPYLGSQEFNDARDRINHLGPETVTTMQIDFTDAIAVEGAQAFADNPGYDIRVTWAGFAIGDPEHDPNPIASGGILGYGTCLEADSISDDTLAASSAGFSRTVSGSPASVEGSLDSVIAALENLEEHPEWLQHLTFRDIDSSEVVDVINELSDAPRVRTLVLTGPSDEIARYVGDNTADIGFARVLGIDFYDWSQGVCGR